MIFAAPKEYFIVDFIKKKLADFFRCKKGINKKALCLKRSWDEVSHLLDAACKKRGRPKIK